MGYIDKDILLDIITKEDVIRILNDLGSKDYRKSGQDLIFRSICHNSNSFKLYYYHEKSEDYPTRRTFHCYSKCGESFQIFELVIRVNRLKGKTITFYQALAYIAKMIGYNEEEFYPVKVDKETLINDWEWINLLSKEVKEEVKELKEYSESILEVFCYYPHEEFLNDGISMETLSEFEIGYFGRDNAITIPHRDMNNRLIGIRQRHLDEYDIENYGKYLPVMISGEVLKHKLGYNLYGIHINQKKIKECKKVLLVESEKSVMQNHTIFKDGDFSLATCGSNLTDMQITILLKYLGVQEIILGYDKEYTDPNSFEAEVYRNKLLKLVAPLLNYCRVSLLWDTKGYLDYKDSPTDKGEEVLLKLLDEKIEITKKDLALLN